MAKINFKITPERVALACGIIEWMNLKTKDRETVFRVAPRFVVNDKDEYEMTIHHNEDGDIESFEGYAETLTIMSKVTPQRLEKLIDEFGEAARNIVNPPNGKA